MKFTPKVKTIIGLSIAVAAPSISMVVSFSVLAHKKLQSTKIPTFSLNPKTPNLLFLYSDGLDDRILNDVKGKGVLEHTFDDFYKFNKLRSYGPSTYYNLNLLGGDLRNNSWPALYRKTGSTPKADSKQISKGVNTFVESLDNIYGKNNINKFIINLEEDIVHKSGINHVSFDGIKNALFSGGWGAGSISAVSSAFRFLQKTDASPSSKPAFVFSADLASHYVYTDRNGDYKWHPNSTLKQAVISQNKYLNDTFNHLKEISNDKTNAYDNTLIIVWGDHANHCIDISTWEGFARKTNPSLFIKYPNQSFAHYKEVNDYTITQTQMHKITEDFFRNKDKYLNGTDPLTFFEKYKDTNFRVDRPTLVFDHSSYILGSYVGNKYVKNKNQPAWTNFTRISQDKWEQLLNKYEEWHD